MARTKSLRVWLTFVCTLSLLSPHPHFASQTFAQAPTQSSRTRVPKTIDVSLDAGNHLQGKVVNAEGLPAANADVQVFHPKGLVATARTNQRGEFRTGAIAGGSYQLVTASQSMHLRAWTQNSAPPSATPNLLVAETNVVRGQCCSTECQIPSCDGACGAGAYCGGGVGMLIHPMVIGAAVAAAIVIPLALDDDDDDAS